MDDGVRLNTSLFTPDGTAVPNGWPATVLCGAWPAAWPPLRRGDEREFAIMRRCVLDGNVHGHNQFVSSKLDRMFQVQNDVLHLSCPAEGASIGYSTETVP